MIGSRMRRGVLLLAKQLFVNKFGLNAVYIAPVVYVEQYVAEPRGDMLRRRPMYCSIAAMDQLG